MVGSRIGTANGVTPWCGVPLAVVYPNSKFWVVMSVTIFLIRNMLTSSSPRFEGSSRWIRKSFLPVLVVSAFNCFHTEGINITCLGLRLHQPNMQKCLIPSKVKGKSVGSTVYIVAAID